MTGTPEIDARELAATAREAVRYKVEQELRKLPLDERVARTLFLCSNAKGECALTVRVHLALTKPGYRAECGDASSDPGGRPRFYDSVDDAITQLGVSNILTMEEQIEKLRLAIDTVDTRLTRARGPR